MKLLVLLIAALAVGWAGEIRGVIWGVLECDRPFYAQVTLWDIDGGLHGDDDEFAAPQEFHPTPGLLHVTYMIDGVASDPGLWDFDGVEPRLAIKHTCAGDEHWLCKDYGPTKGYFHLTENVKLNDTADIALKEFYDCDSKYKAKPYIAKPGVRTLPGIGRG